MLTRWMRRVVGKNGSGWMLLNVARQLSSATSSFSPWTPFLKGVSDEHLLLKSLVVSATTEPGRTAEFLVDARRYSKYGKSSSSAPLLADAETERAVQALNLDDVAHAKVVKALVQADKQLFRNYMHSIGLNKFNSIVHHLAQATSASNLSKNDTRCDTHNLILSTYHANALSRYCASSMKDMMLTAAENPDAVNASSFWEDHWNNAPPNKGSMPYSLRVNQINMETSDGKEFGIFGSLLLDLLHISCAGNAFAPATTYLELMGKAQVVVENSSLSDCLHLLSRGDSSHLTTKMLRNLHMCDADFSQHRPHILHILVQKELTNEEVFSLLTTITTTTPALRTLVRDVLDDIIEQVEEGKQPRYVVSNLPFSHGRKESSASDSAKKTKDSPPSSSSSILSFGLFTKAADKPEDRLTAQEIYAHELQKDEQNQREVERRVLHIDDEYDDDAADVQDNDSQDYSNNSNGTDYDKKINGSNIQHKDSLQSFVNKVSNSNDLFLEGEEGEEGADDGNFVAFDEYLENDIETQGFTSRLLRDVRKRRYEDKISVDEDSGRTKYRDENEDEGEGGGDDNENDNDDESDLDRETLRNHKRVLNTLLLYVAHRRDLVSVADVLQTMKQTNVKLSVASHWQVLSLLQSTANKSCVKLFAHCMNISDTGLRAASGLFQVINKISSDNTLMFETIAILENRNQRFGNAVWKLVLPLMKRKNINMIDMAWEKYREEMSDNQLLWFVKAKLDDLAIGHPSIVSQEGLMSPVSEAEMKSRSTQACNLIDECFPDGKLLKEKEDFLVEITASDYMNVNDSAFVHKVAALTSQVDCQSRFRYIHWDLLFMTEGGEGLEKEIIAMKKKKAEMAAYQFLVQLLNRVHENSSNIDIVKEALFAIQRSRHVNVPDLIQNVTKNNLPLLERKPHANHALQSAVIEARIVMHPTVHVNFLKAHAGNGDVNNVLRSIVMMRKAGLHINVSGYKIVLSTFARRGYFQAARKTFDLLLEQLPKPSVGIFNIVLSAVSTPSDLDEVQHLLSQMSSLKVHPNSQTFVILARKHLRFNQPQKALNLLSAIPMNNMEISAPAISTWMRAFKECQTQKFAPMVAFYSAVEAHPYPVDNVIFTVFATAIDEFLKRLYMEKLEDTAIPLWKDLEEEATEAKDIVQRLYDRHSKDARFGFTMSVLRCCKYTGDVDLAKKIYKDMKSRGMHVPLQRFIVAAANGDDIDTMMHMHQQMKAENRIPSLYTYTCMIAAFGRVRDIDGAMDVYDEMIANKIYPNHTLNRTLIEVCHIDRTSVLENAARFEKLVFSGVCVCCKI
eukprot:m.121690 g.121690  ORF g.121690 m.121690 type:complete len:1304 (-) comp9379_c0_seq23:1541-5452(-)